MVCTASVIALLRSAGGGVAVWDGKLQASTLIDKIIIAAKSFLTGFIAFSFN